MKTPSDTSKRANSGQELLDTVALAAVLVSASGLLEMTAAGALLGGAESTAAGMFRSVSTVIAAHLAFGTIVGMMAFSAARFAAGISLLPRPRPLGFGLATAGALFLPALAALPASLGFVGRAGLAGLISLAAMAAALLLTVRGPVTLPRKAMIAACVAMLVLGLATDLFSGGKTGGTADASRPDVILISLDTVRPDHLEPYGYTLPTSPNLAAFAREAVVFDEAFASEPWTLPTHMSMMTSLYPLSHGVVSRDTRLNTETTTLARVLADNGYRSAGFVPGGEESWTASQRGFGAGFNDYHHAPHQLRNARGTSLLRFYESLQGPASGSAADINASVAQYLSIAPPDPMFLFLHYYDAHSDFTDLPYEAPAPLIDMFVPGGLGGFEVCSGEIPCASHYLGTRDPSNTSDEDQATVRGLYDAGIRALDDELGLLFENLRNVGRFDNTLIIITADHGEEMMEHGRFLHTQVYDETLRVPLLIKYPGGSAAGTRFATAAEHVDLMPTVLDVAGISYQGDMQGRSLADTATTAADPADGRYVFFSNTDQGGDFVTREIGMRTPDRKLIISIEDIVKERPTEAALRLFDLHNDPRELDNLAASGLPADADWMRQAVWAWFDESRRHVDLRPPERSVVLSPEEMERLRSLGYLR